MAVGHFPNATGGPPLQSNGQLVDSYPPGPLANRPPASWLNTGWQYLATDQNGGTLYQSNGTTWIQAAAGVTGGTLSGDVTGPINSNTVVQVNGVPAKDWSYLHAIANV